MLIHALFNSSQNSHQLEYCPRGDLIEKFILRQVHLKQLERPL